MSALRFGPAGGLPAGYARCEAGTTLMRGHSPNKAPDWFGPAVGRVGVHRFDVPLRTEDDPGVCYLAPSLEGVLLERVIRDSTINPLSHATLSREHAITAARLTRDFVLIDLLATPWTVHGVQMHAVAAVPPYGATQQLARQLTRLTLPQPDGTAMCPDGIAYGSRFGAAHECIALWDRAATALAWGETVSLGADRNALALATTRLGVGLRE